MKVASELIPESSGLLKGQVGNSGLSPLQDRTLELVRGRSAKRQFSKTVNKGGTALMTPFADICRQRAFLWRTFASDGTVFFRKETI